ncbi:hypothetical protein INR49_015165 [Caranx melampygus]|nr:hypothetical protein INR49_015165 [Caranx melampygus]
MEGTGNDHEQEQERVRHGEQAKRAESGTRYTSLHRWPLACLTDNYLLNTPGSDSVHVRVLVFGQLPCSQHSSLKGGGISATKTICSVITTKTASGPIPGKSFPATLSIWSPVQLRVAYQIHDLTANCWRRPADAGSELAKGGPSPCLPVHHVLLSLQQLEMQRRRWSAREERRGEKDEEEMVTDLERTYGAKRMTGTYTLKCLSALSVWRRGVRAGRRQYLRRHEFKGCHSYSLPPCLYFGKVLPSIIIRR